MLKKLQRVYFLWKPGRNWLPHHYFNDFHKSIHNLRQIFHEIRSRAKAEFHVCRWGSSECSYTHGEMFSLTTIGMRGINLQKYSMFLRVPAFLKLHVNTQTKIRLLLYSIFILILYPLIYCILESLIMHNNFSSANAPSTRFKG